MEETSVYIDGFLKQNYDLAKEVIKNDWDMCFLFDGAEGTGKSTLACQSAYYCDNSFNLDSCVFTHKEFEKAILTADKYKAVVYDEAYTGLSSRGTMSLINRTLIKLMAEIRQRNLFIFIVMPTYFDLDKYIALFRSRALIHIYNTENFQRGYFGFYNVDRKKDLYILGKKFYSYVKPRPNFYGRFTDWLPFDREEYKKKKANALKNRLKEQEENQFKQELENMLFIRLVEDKQDLTHEQKANLLNMPISTYYFKLREYKANKEEKGE